MVVDGVWMENKQLNFWIISFTEQSTVAQTFFTKKVVLNISTYDRLLYTIKKVQVEGP